MRMSNGIEIGRGIEMGGREAASGREAGWHVKRAGVYPGIHLDS